MAYRPLQSSQQGRTQLSILSKSTVGKQPSKRRTFIYGTHKIGKTTWAASWPDAIVVDIEGGSGDLDVARTPKLGSAVDVFSVTKEIRDSGDYGTLILDSIDWLESLVEKSVDESDFDKGYGQGVVEVGRRVGLYLGLLDEVIDSGKHVVIIGHSAVKTVTRPDGTSWSRHEPRLSKRALALCCEWSDELLFADVKVSTQTKTVGHSKINVGQNGDRVLHTVGKASYEAGHRASGLKDMYSLSDFNGYFSDLNN